MEVSNKNYQSSLHAAERLVERFNEIAINIVEAGYILPKLMARSVPVNKKHHRPWIKSYLNTDLNAILVVNEDKKVVVTIYKVR